MPSASASKEVASLDRKMETRRAKIDELKAAMFDIDPTDFAALTAQQEAIAPAAQEELEEAPDGRPRPARTRGVDPHRARRGLEPRGSAAARTPVRLTRMTSSRAAPERGTAPRRCGSRDACASRLAGAAEGYHAVHA